MPGGNGTGPREGPKQRGGRLGGNQSGIGPCGNCICPGCGEKVPHRQGTPCYQMNCPRCGSRMIRE